MKPDQDSLDSRNSTAWLRLDLAESDPLAAAFAVAAMLGRLHSKVREEREFSGAFRQRMALQVAARTGMRRVIDAETLRDLLYLTAEGDDPGPQGRALQAWRLLARPGAASMGVMAQAAALFGLPNNHNLSGALEAAAAAIAAPTDAIPPMHAARVGGIVFRSAPEAELLAFWCADAALAAAMGWPRAIPLLGSGLSARGASLTLGELSPAAEGKICAAYARAARKAADVHAEIERAAARLAAATSKLRSKQASRILDRLLTDDAVAGSARVPGMTPRSVRRLFDRLVALGAVRELTGRATFRLYGL